MPMLMDTAGNCGNQISTLMVRGLALGEVEPADFMRVLAKELRVSAIVGAVLGIVNEKLAAAGVPESQLTNPVTDFSGNYTARAHTFSIGVGFSF